MSHEYKISIIVPTKNREEYALNTAKQVLSINNKQIQLVIQDNSNNNKLEEILNSHFSDKRLKYNYSAQTLSFVDNFSKAVSLADGEYICIIGDDDGVNPEIVELAEWASKRQIKAIKPEVQAVYFWPDAINSVGNGSDQNGYLEISDITTDVRIAETKSEIVKLLKNGCQRYLSLDLVKLYHGLVRKECMDEIFKVTGSYFAGLSPDIYSAVALSVIIPEVVCIDYPITISGICKKSGSADSATGRHTGDLKDAPHFIGHSNYKWSNQVPPFYSVETIWADSAIAAINDMGKNSLLEAFSLESLTVNCLIKYKKYRDLIINHYLEKDKNRKMQKALKILKLRGAMLYILIRVLLKRLKKGRRKNVKFSDINNILDAQKICSDYLLSKGLNINQVIDKIVLVSKW